MGKIAQTTKWGASIKPIKSAKPIKPTKSLRPKAVAEAKRLVLGILRKNKDIEWVVGIDEVGRGPIAGPVTMCTFAVSRDIFVKGITKEFKGQISKTTHAHSGNFTDSKKMTSKSRVLWNKIIRDTCDKSDKMHFEIKSRTATQIDKEGISNSIKLIVRNMLESLQDHGMTSKNTIILLDGSLVAPNEYRQITVIKGDLYIDAISLASILAKESRDTYMRKMATKFPKYGFEKHVGYGTKIHMENIKKFGVCELHRKTWIK